MEEEEPAKSPRELSCESAPSPGRTPAQQWNIIAKISTPAVLASWLPALAASCYQFILVSNNQAEDGQTRV